MKNILIIFPFIITGFLFCNEKSKFLLNFEGNIDKTYFIQKISIIDVKHLTKYQYNSKILFKANISNNKAKATRLYCSGVNTIKCINSKFEEWDEINKVNINIMISNNSTVTQNKYIGDNYQFPWEDDPDPISLLNKKYYISKFEIHNFSKHTLANKYETTWHVYSGNTNRKKMKDLKNSIYRFEIWIRDDSMVWIEFYWNSNNELVATTESHIENSEDNIAETPISTEFLFDNFNNAYNKTYLYKYRILDNTLVGEGLL